MRFSGLFSDKKFFLSTVLLTLLLSFFSVGGAEEKVVQPNLLAGTWYPARAEELKSQLETFFAAADVNPAGDVTALILPHAGYRYSGRTAAFGVKRASVGRYQRIVVMGPSHHTNLGDNLSVPAATHYSTPLGQVALDTVFIGRLKENKLFTTMPPAHHSEHSVQIELPLLQYAFGDFKLVPIVTGRCSKETIKKAAEIVKDAIDDKTLVVASSDFTHYGPGYGYVPFDTNIPQNIKKLDMGAFERIKGLDGEGFLDYRRDTGATICGFVPIAILLEMLKAGTEAEIVKYTTSGEITGDFNNSVSYMSVAFHRCKAGHRQEKKAVPASSNDEDKKRLLALARRSLEYYLEHRKIPKVSELGIEPTEKMRKTGAAFVTLKRHSYLRGCIGHTHPTGPLYESVIVNAINAGFNDWRFPPIVPDEMKLIQIEISVISEPAQVSSPNDIKIGIDGVLFRKDGRSALFLPQVAVEQKWDLKRMLKNLSLKAGLDADAWKQGGEFYTFRADVFGEAER